MSEFMKLLLSLSLSGTMLLFLTLLLKRVYKNKAGKCWQYYIWLMVVLRFLLPFTPDTTVVGAFFTASGRMAVTDSAMNQASEDGPVTEEAADRGGDATAREGMGTVYWYAFLVWAAVAMAFLVKKITAYQGFIRCIRAGSREVSDLETLNLLADCEDKQGIRKTVELYSSPLVSSPILIGLFRSAVVLPAGQDRSGLPYVFAHELVHYKRRDMFYKWFVQVVVCIHWFNPVVYLLEKEVNRACELSCDEAVLHLFGDTEKKAYGDTLLTFLRTDNAYGSSLASVMLTEGAEQLKERLDAIMNLKKKSKRTTAVAICFTTVICVCFAAFGAYAVSYGKEAAPSGDEEVNMTGTVNADALRVRREASGDADITGLFQKAQEVSILSEQGEYYKISILVGGSSFEGYVKKEYIDVDVMKTKN